jgi:hypothetical protein
MHISSRSPGCSNTRLGTLKAQEQPTPQPETTPHSFPRQCVDRIDDRGSYLESYFGAEWIPVFLCSFRSISGSRSCRASQLGTMHSMASSALKL